MRSAFLPEHTFPSAMDWWEWQKTSKQTKTGHLKWAHVGESINSYVCYSGWWWGAFNGNQRTGQNIGSKLENKLILPTYLSVFAWKVQHCCIAISEFQYLKYIESSIFISKLFHKTVPQNVHTDWSEFVLPLVVHKSQMATSHTDVSFQKWSGTLFTQKMRGAKLSWANMRRNALNVWRISPSCCLQNTMN